MTDQETSGTPGESGKPGKPGDPGKSGGEGGAGGSGGDGHAPAELLKSIRMLSIGLLVVVFSVAMYVVTSVVTKQNTSQVASGLRHHTDAVARDLSKHTDDVAKGLRHHTDEVAAELKMDTAATTLRIFDGQAHIQRLICADLRSRGVFSSIDPATGVGDCAGR